jgi:hypothetical protein
MPLISPPTPPRSALVVSVLSVGLVISVLGAVAAPNFGDPLPNHVRALFTSAGNKADRVGPT